MHVYEEEGPMYTAHGDGNDKNDKNDNNNAISDDTTTAISQSVIKTVKGLAQQMIFIPERVKDVYLVSLLDDLATPLNPSSSVRSVIIFCSTCRRAQLTTYLLRSLTKAPSVNNGDNLNDKRLHSNFRNNITVLHSRLSQRER